MINISVLLVWMGYYLIAACGSSEQEVSKYWTADEVKSYLAVNSHDKERYMSENPNDLKQYLRIASQQRMGVKFYSSLQ